MGTYFNEVKYIVATFRYLSRPEISRLRELSLEISGQDKIASRVAIYRSGTIDEDSATHAEIREWCITKLISMKNVFTVQLLRSVSD